MTLPRLVRRNVLRHPVRAGLTFLFAALSLFLFVFLRSAVTTLESAVHGAAADRLAVQSAVSLFVSLPRSYREKIERVDGVKSACPWTWFGGYYRSPRNFFANFGADLATLLEQYPEIVIVDGSAKDLLAERRACIVGVDLAAQFGWKVGDTVPLVGTIYPRDDGRGWEMVIRAIYRSTRPNVDDKTMWFHWDYLQEMRSQIRVTRGSTSNQDVSVFMVKTAPGHAPEAVIDAIDAVFDGGPQRTRTQTEAAFQAQFVSMMGNIPTFLAWIGGAVLFAIFFAVLNTAGIAGRERSRDAGILKALGFSDALPARLLLAESVAVVTGGAVVGLALAWLSVPGFRRGFGTMLPNYQVTPATLGLGLAIGLAIGALGGWLPGARLARLRPVDVLRDEG